MKPLVFWCRWNEARLRLAGRDETSIWGELAFATENKPFRFNLKTHQLTIADDAPLQLDEMGVVIKETRGLGD